MAGDAEADAVGGLAVVGSILGDGVGFGVPVEDVTLVPGLGAELELAEGTGRGEDAAAGLVEEDGLVSGSTGIWLPGSAVG
jgi:hypothetical protein